MLIENKKIAIVGGGPGGLMLARLLQLKGAAVKVYERDADKNVRQQGATLDLHEESGLKAMKAAGLMDQFLLNYRPGADKIRIVDEYGNICFDEHNDAAGTDYNRPEIDRGPLRDILIKSLQPDTIVWDAQFLSMNTLKEGWELQFRNESIAYADIVIGADGANSRIRPFITSIKPVYSGVTCVEGNIYHAEKNAPCLNARLKGGKIFALGKEKSLILSAKGDGSLSFYTGTKETENWVSECSIDFKDRKQVFEWFSSRFSDWGTTWHELFATDEMYFVPRPMYHYPSDQSWNALSNLTMLGDAAHLMPPYAGEGVNMAMLDALELAECLTNDVFENVHAAIAYYEKQMLNRTSEVTKDTLLNTEWLHSANGLQTILGMFSEMRTETTTGQQ